MEVKSNHIKVDGTELTVSPINENNFSLKEMQEIVGGYITLVNLKDGFVLVVNEDGIHQGLSFNKKASKIAGISLVGDVLHTHIKLIK